MVEYPPRRQAPARFPITRQSVRIENNRGQMQGRRVCVTLPSLAPRPGPPYAISGVRLALGLVVLCGKGEGKRDEKKGREKEEE